MTNPATNAATSPRANPNDLESPFPESPRVIYRTNPLEQVICQLRFPAILRISTDLPTGFQEAVRGDYPLLRETKGIAAPSELPAELASLVSNLMSGAGTAYDFESADGNWDVSLTRDFIALTTKDYRRWEEFRGRLERVIGVLISQYNPPFITRLGLRYRDAICPDSMGLETHNWRDLLAPHVLGELSEEAVATVTEEATRTLLLSIPEGRVRIRHGIGERTETKEQCYVIDADFFTDERMDIADVIGALDRFNRHAGRLYRWFITSRLHEALGPDPA